MCAYLRHIGGLILPICDFGCYFVPLGTDVGPNDRRTSKNTLFSLQRPTIENRIFGSLGSVLVPAGCIIWPPKRYPLIHLGLWKHPLPLQFRNHFNSPRGHILRTKTNHGRAHPISGDMVPYIPSRMFYFKCSDEMRLKLTQQPWIIISSYLPGLMSKTFVQYPDHSRLSLPQSCTGQSHYVTHTPLRAAGILFQIARTLKIKMRQMTSPLGSFADFWMIEMRV